MTTITDRDASARTATAREAVGRDLPWLGLPIGVGATVYVVYILTHPYPAFGAGLFLQIAEAVAAAGYRLPARIPGYTAGGVPFAYPPLPFYLLAVLVEAGGLNPIAVSRFLPGAFVVAALVPYYYVAKAFFASAPRAGLATSLLAVAPTVLRWHLSAGGVVRALAFLFVAVGLYAGVRLFAGEHGREAPATRVASTRGRGEAPRRRTPWRWLVLGAVAFGLTVLSHPIYAVYFGVSYVVLFWFLDRSIRGLATGVVVALGGFGLAAPWFLQVVSTHGVDVFLGAAGTHDGLGGGLHRIGTAFLAPLVPDAETPFFLAVYAGMAYHLYRRDYLLPAWLLAGGYVVGKTRFLFVPGAMMTAVFVFDWLVPRASDVAGRRADADPERLRHLAGSLTVGVVLLLAVGLGGLAAAGGLSIWHDSASQPAFVDDDDLAAMRWSMENTERGASFVVLGDAAEWVPLLADRSILVGHWGAEWEGAGEYQRQLDRYRDVSACHTEQCVTETLARVGVHPDYVYVPKGDYTIRGVSHHAPADLAGSMDESGRYERVYENDGVAIFRVVGGPG